MIKLGLCQFKTSENKNENLDKAQAFITMAKNQEAGIIVLPEMFNCLYSGKSFLKESELEGGQSYKFLKEASSNCILIGGSIPERDTQGNIYNTSYIFENGQLLGKHRKIHLFDIDFNNVKMQESSYLTPGNETTVVETSLGKIGVAICFDLRFPELFLEMNKNQPFLYVIPAAFNNVTGPVHFSLLGRSRAVDFQSFVALCSSASNPEASYDPYGHSTVIDPWGNTLGELDNSEGVLIQKIKLNQLNLIRESLPLKR